MKINWNIFINLFGIKDMYIKNIIIYFFMLVVSNNTYAKTLNKEITVFIDSVSLNENHTKYYAIYDINLNPSKEIKSSREKTKIQGLYYPYIRSILPSLDRGLGILDYIKMTDDIFIKDKLRESSLFPIVISLGYFYGENPDKFNSSLVLHIEARSYFIPDHKPHQITFSDVSKYYKAYPDANLLTLPLWSITISSSSGHPQEKEFNLISMVKCATPYLNKNFKGTITCKR